MTEYPADCVYPSRLQYQNGTTVKLYSAACPAVTQLHFKWLYDYGLDGVFLQRFVSEVTQQFRNTQFTTFVQRNAVLQNIMNASVTYGRVFAIEYDVSGANDNTVFGDITTDWQFLVNNLSMAASPRYLHHVSLNDISWRAFCVSCCAHPNNIEW